MSLPDWPKEIQREGPYRIYKGVKYTVYNDGNSAETPYQTDLAEAAIARLKLALKEMANAQAEARYGRTSEAEIRLSIAILDIGPIPE